MKKIMAMMMRNSIQQHFLVIYILVLWEKNQKLLKMPTTDEATDAALTAINCLDIKHQDKVSVSKTSKL